MSENDIKILQAGMPDSGIFWLYDIVQEILKSKEIECKSFIRNHPVYEGVKNRDYIDDKRAGMDIMDIEPGRCYYRVNAAVRNPIFYLPDYVRRCSHVCTFSETNSETENVLHRFDKIIYIVRDPRDTAIAAANFAFTPYMKRYHPHDFNSVEEYLDHNFEGLLLQWKRHLLEYLMLRDSFKMYFIPYENVIDDFKSGVEQLSTYLGFQLSNNEVLNIYKAVNFDGMKTKDNGHFRNGKSMRWDEYLSPEQHEISCAIAGEVIEMLGYPVVPGEGRKNPLDINTLPLEEVKKAAEQMDPVLAKV